MSHTSDNIPEDAKPYLEFRSRLDSASLEMFEALKGIEEFAQAQINDLGADIQEGGKVTDRWRAALARWNAVMSAIAKAEGKQ